MRMLDVWLLLYILIQVYKRKLTYRAYTSTVQPEENSSVVKLSL